MTSPNGGAAAKSPAELIDARIEELGDWRGETLARIRQLIKQAVPDVVEEWKWRGVPVWYHDGMLCTGETYKNVVKMTFAKGASLQDPAGLFNSSLDGNTRRAIDFHEADTIDEKALRRSFAPRSTSTVPSAAPTYTPAGAVLYSRPAQGRRSNERPSGDVRIGRGISEPGQGMAGREHATTGSGQGGAAGTR